jgi:hypothetical protein
MPILTAQLQRNQVIDLMGVGDVGDLIAGIYRILL